MALNTVSSDRLSTNVKASNLNSGFGQLGHRNKIFNGKMEVDQHNFGSAANIEGNSVKYHLDRWSVQGSQLDELSASVQQVDDAPAGFYKSMKITTNTPESAIAANEFVSVYQKMEGKDFQDLEYNTSGAKDITMSFWVKSSVTGTYSFTIYRDEPGTDRIVNKTYTINSANTWEKKTITVAGDTGRGIQDTTGAVWWNCWHLAAGSDYDSVTSSTWANYSTTNWAGGQAQDGVITTNGATWYITGVQLETGSVATDFEHRPYGLELALCQRYFQHIAQNTDIFYTIYTDGNFNNRLPYNFPIMRAAPTATKSQRVNTNGTLSFSEMNTNGFTMNIARSGSGMQDAGFDFKLSAEL